MIKKHSFKAATLLAASSVLLACSQAEQSASTEALSFNRDALAQTRAEQTQKPVVYQVFTRLFGNQVSNNVSWGTKEQNGVGKFADFTPKALEHIKSLGVTHIWYTGVLHHGVIGDYTEYGISLDDPDVVKGRAGSPYAVKDYYNVNPDLAVNPETRLAEFEALIARSHAAGLKVVIDIVPNHVARNYQSLTNPEGEQDFGSQDNTQVEYQRDNNFYYVVGEQFKVPAPLDGYQPLGGDAHPLADGAFNEMPAKWTGNGARLAQPHHHDWYETVKINYGVRPDGSYDFPRLPESYANKDWQAHYEFWQDKDLPDSWSKFKAITQYWLAKGVDGFRYDMAEMVPVEFWSYLNSEIKATNPDAFLLAEVYNPALYRDYLKQGKMDYLYDKVGLYDTLKPLMQGKGSAKAVLAIHEQVADIAPSMLHFLENHDEQRIASPEFAGDANMGKPAMVVSTLLSSSPVMIYFGQTVGEDGSEDAGFGKPSRTSIFDYIGVPAHQRLMNGGAFDGGQLNKEEKALHAYYETLLPLSHLPEVQTGDYTNQLAAIRVVDSQTGESRDDTVVAFSRAEGALWVLSNFNRSAVTVTVDAKLAGYSQLLNDKITLSREGQKTRVTLEPLGSAVLQK